MYFFNFHLDIMTWNYCIRFNSLYQNTSISPNLCFGGCDILLLLSIQLLGIYEFSLSLSLAFYANFISNPKMRRVISLCFAIVSFVSCIFSIQSLVIKCALSSATSLSIDANCLKCRRVHGGCGVVVHNEAPIL